MSAGRERGRRMNEENERMETYGRYCQYIVTKTVFDALSIGGGLVDGGGRFAYYTGKTLFKDTQK